ncbi:hypothetical protein NQD34_018174 [Periophthalmus magnuspinnatus]|nr:hypothetical protein NQD34_018174 [Periophthalmus magnuspinnatus]
MRKKDLFPSSDALIFYQALALMTIECDRWAFSNTSQRFSMGLRSGLCGGQSMCESMLPEPLIHNLSLMNPGIVILEYARAIREEKNPLNNLIIQYIQVVS